MILSTPLLKQTSEKQDIAELEFTTFSDPIQHAMALAEFFDNIEAEEYVVPTVPNSIGPGPEIADHPVKTVYTSL